uniref:hypothetical protein n=1 Tax=Enterocloster clostridioformis TaxID=1531 RepID=UPI0026F30F82|nr:hypothetical protein [Enterocloster clostridioformis]
MSGLGWHRLWEWILFYLDFCAGKVNAELYTEQELKGRCLSLGETGERACSPLQPMGMQFGGK